MQVHRQSLRELIHNNLLMGYEAIIKFWGPDHSRNIAPPEPSRWTTSVKIEITIHEIIKFDPVLRSIRHPFTDQLTYNEPIPCYSLEEVVAEKLRALIQRSYTAPRDYYDLWYILSKNLNLRTDEIALAFFDKLAFKKLRLNGINDLIDPNKQNQVQKAWTNSLGHQINPASLPEFAIVSAYLRGVILDILNLSDLPRL
jgi:hypothetical protein